MRAQLARPGLAVAAGRRFPTFIVFAFVIRRFHRTGLNARTHTRTYPPTRLDRSGVRCTIGCRYRAARRYRRAQSLRCECCFSCSSHFAVPLTSRRISNRCLRLVRRTMHASLYGDFVGDASALKNRRHHPYRFVCYSRDPIRCARLQLE